MLVIEIDCFGLLLEFSYKLFDYFLREDYIELFTCYCVFGAVWLGWILWRALKLDEQCEALLASKRETVGWAEVIAILVIARLCEPSSELHVAEQWYRTTALNRLTSSLPLK